MENARRLYAEPAYAYAMGREAPYADGLLSSAPACDTADPEAIAAPSMANQAVEKAQGLFAEWRHTRNCIIRQASPTLSAGRPTGAVSPARCRRVPWRDYSLKASSAVRYPSV